MKRGTIIILQDKLRGGGTERNSIWLANQFHRAGYPAHLLVFEEPAATIDGIDAPVSYLRRPSCLGEWYAPRLTRRLRQLHPATVLCMGRNANCHGWWIQQRLPHLRVITTCRTNRPLPLPYRVSIRRSDFCLVNSQWAADKLIHSGLIPSQRLKVIPNPLIRTHLLALERTAANQQAARQRLGIGPNTPVLCNVAHFVHGKNQQALIRTLAAITASPAPILLLVGDGPERPRCQQLADELGLAAQVRCCGRMETIYDILLASDLFVSTALRESLPNTIVEAQAAGLPVVAFDTAGTREAFAPDASGRIVPPNDDKQLHTAIEGLLQDPAQLSAFSSHARKFARQQFEPNAVFKQFEDVMAH